MHSAFAPFQSLAETLLPHIDDAGDGSHDIAHLIRVYRNARAIAAKEDGDPALLAAAVLLHDCVYVEKSDPRRAQASRLAAAKAGQVLAAMGWTPARVAAVTHAIETHSFSAGLKPQSLEARILQDADRLDAIGVIGAARCFYLAGRMGSALYDPADPEALNRPLDDRAFAIDHFKTKLLRLSSGFQTVTGAGLAALRHQRLEQLLADFLSEI